jgi:hypothetical protein
MAIDPRGVWTLIFSSVRGVGTRGAMRHLSMRNLVLKKLFTFASVPATVVLLLVTGVFHPSFGQGEDLDPLRVCPDTQKLVLENAFVRVIEERVPPGGVQKKHRHPHGVTIALSDFENDGFNYTENRSTKTRRTAGSIIRIELKY